MTERTLEEIEAHIKARGSSSIGYDLLAIAQGQRGREKLIVEAAISAIRQERRWRLEDSECGGCEINESCDRAERQFRDLVTGIGTKK